jgi:hypothetical protein
MAHQSMGIEAISNAELGCMGISSDRARANLRGAFATFDGLPEHVLGLYAPCGHHIGGSVAKPLTDYLDLTCPMFCAVKQLHRGHRWRRVRTI